MNKSFIRVTLFLMLMSFASSVITEVYQWRDSKGKLHFSDSPPKNDKAKLLDEKELSSRISSYTNVSVQIEPIDFGLNPQTNRKIVVMYATLRCPFCAKARAHFSRHNIDYIEKDIERSQKYKAEFKAFNGTGVPVIFYGKYRMNGFSKERFEENYAMWRN